MKIRYKIEDLNAKDYVVDFEFHKELDNSLVFESAWTIAYVIEYTESGYDDLTWKSRIGNKEDDEEILKWLVDNEWKIYLEAERYSNL